MSAQTRAHVRQVISELGFRPDPVARALASGHGAVVELVVVDDAAVFGTSPYYGRVTAGILQELTGSNAQLRVHVGLPDISAVGKFRREAGYELTQRLLAEEPGLDAIFAGCDLMAAGAMQALVNRQLAPHWRCVFPAVLQVRQSSA